VTAILVFISIAAAGIAAAAFMQSHTLSTRLAAALGGSDTDSLESKLARQFKRSAEIEDRLHELESEQKKLAVTGSLASQKISIVRFNPFGDTGGDQSFSLAVLDAQDSGYVLTSIHGRGGTRVYVKPLDFGKGKYSLSSEEQQALAQAAKRVPKID